MKKKFKLKIITALVVIASTVCTVWVVANVVKRGFQAVEVRCFAAEHEFYQSINK